MNRLTLLAILFLVPGLAPAKETPSDALTAELDRMFEAAYPAMQIRGSNCDRRLR